MPRGRPAKMGKNIERCVGSCKECLDCVTNATTMAEVKKCLKECCDACLKEEEHHHTKSPSRSPGRAKTPKGRAKTPKGRAKTPKGRAKTPKGRAKTPKGRAKTPKGRAKTPARKRAYVKRT